MRREHQRKIHWQLAFRVGAVILVLGVAFLLGDGALQRKRLIESRAAYMEQEVQLIGMAVRKVADAGERARFLESYCATMRFHGRPGHALGIIDTSGRFFKTDGALSEEQIVQSPPVRQLLSASSGSRHWIERTGQGRSLVAAGVYRTPGGDQVGLVYYSEWVEDILRLSRILFWQRAGLLLVLLLAVSSAIWLFVKIKVANPLGALLMREYAASKGDLQEWALPDPHNEVSAVCHMFNYMLRRTEQREEELRAGAAPDSYASALAGIEEGLACLRKAAHWMETRGDALTDEGRRTLTEMRKREQGLSHLASVLKGELEGMPSFHEREPDELDEGADD
ncbi:MAG: hypothetical protein ACYS8K_01020 [Planctomycetota bacterium]|jgi:hypothetical protein